MKVRFYCNVPPNGAFEVKWLNASADHTMGLSVPLGWIRVAFDVNFPDELVRRHDLVAPAEFAGVVDDELPSGEADE